MRCAMTTPSSPGPAPRPPDRSPMHSRRGRSGRRLSAPAARSCSLPARSGPRCPRGCRAGARRRPGGRKPARGWSRRSGKWLPTWIGRSPVLATVMATVSRPSFRVISPSAVRSSPGGRPSPKPAVRRRPAVRRNRGRGIEEAAVERQRVVSALRHDRLVDGDQLRAVRERALHLHLADHLRDAVEDVGVPRRRRPRSISSATGRPSRMNSRSCVAIRATAST